ncbi:MAG: LacI family DNA-binding transcriptional regulator [Kiritimatiellae bacterium]|nr:LacI family DNA-binding transcriptional regulator [Kiritimatiellia bacterium]
MLKCGTTIAEIAAEAGVSKSAVSYVLNGRAKRISADTSKRIREVAKRLDYQPNALVRAIQTKRSHLIGVQWNMLNASISFFGEVMMGMQTVARERGYDVLMAQTGPSPEDSERQIRRFRELRVDGMLIAPCPESAACYASVQEAGLPLVFVNNRVAGSAIPYVQSDDVLGAKLAVRHLIGLGHRRIVTFTNGEKGNFPMWERAEGYRAALREARIPVAPDLIVNAGHESAAEVREAVRSLLARTMVSAFFLSTDLAAIAAMEALREAGKRVPEDVAVVGYANLSEGAHVNPSLTTVDQKTAEMGRLAMTVLIDRIEHPERRHALRNVTTPELVVRASSGTGRQRDTN